MEHDRAQRLRGAVDVALPRAARACAVPRRLRVMQSNGGALSARQARTTPARTVLSGPAGGAVGAHAVGRRSGFPRVIGFDMGGTSTDVTLIDGAIAVTPEAVVGDVPVRLPMIDIHTVGAGGGSLAWIDARRRASRRATQRGGRPGTRLLRRRRGLHRHRRQPAAGTARRTDSLLGGGCGSTRHVPAAWRRLRRPPLGLDVGAACRPACCESRTRRWSGRSASCRSSAASTRAGSRSWPSAAPAACTRARSRTPSRCAPSSCRDTPACCRRSGWSSRTPCATSRGRSSLLVPADLAALESLVAPLELQAREDLAARGVRRRSGARRARRWTCATRARPTS